MSMLTVTLHDGTTQKAPDSLAWEARVSTSALEMGKDVTISTREMRELTKAKRVVRVKRGQHWRVVKSVTEQA